MKTDAPKPFPFAAFDSLAHNNPVAAIQGTITKLYQQKSGTNSVGPWSIQNGELEADGIILPFMLKDRDSLDQSMKGRTVFMTASTAKGITGLYAFDDENHGVTTRKLKVTATATIDIIDGGRSQAAETPPKQEAQTSFQDPAPTDKFKTETWKETPADKQTPHTRTKEDEAFLEARKTINQIANLHLLCMLAVERYEAPAFKKLSGQDMSESQRQAAAASIFIKADREGLTRSMPVVDATKDPRFQA